MFLLSRRSAVMLALSVILAFATTTLLAKTVPRNPVVPASPPPPEEQEENLPSSFSEDETSSSPISKEDALKLLEFCVGLTDVSHWYHKSMMNLAMANNGTFGDYVFSLTEGKDGCTLEESLTGKHMKIEKKEDISEQQRTLSLETQMQMLLKHNVKALQLTGRRLYTQDEDSQDEDNMSVICLISDDNGDDSFYVVLQVDTTPVTNARFNVLKNCFKIGDNAPTWARTVVLNMLMPNGNESFDYVLSENESLEFRSDGVAEDCRVKYNAELPTDPGAGKEFKIDRIQNDKGAFIFGFDDWCDDLAIVGEPYKRTISLGGDVVPDDGVSDDGVLGIDMTYLIGGKNRNGHFAYGYEASVNWVVKNVGNG
eukprot:GHVS01071952.1.p1 GENE.GHVS01071952.1~~GHVS01071952.1.p1  ORF type:complete len:423 (-),score=62.11 GHVS01071952.1:670-1776(-)